MKFKLGIATLAAFASLVATAPAQAKPPPSCELPNVCVPEWWMDLSYGQCKKYNPIGDDVWCDNGRRNWR